MYGCRGVWAFRGLEGLARFRACCLAPCTSSLPAALHRAVPLREPAVPASPLVLASSRFSPVSVASLMQKFESLLSPAAKLATPGQQEGAAAHAAWEALQAAAAQKQ